MVEEAYIRIREPEHPEVIVTAAFCIERDFRGLVERLGRTFEMVNSPTRN